MRFRLAITLAYKNLLRNKIRNVVTGLTICLSVFILILGLGIVGIPTGLIASALTAVRRKEENDGTKNN